LAASATGLQRVESASNSVEQNFSRQNTVIACLLLVAVTILAYIPLGHAGFVILDDVPYILGNPPVRAGLTWTTVKWSFSAVHAGYWHPLTWLSHALDCQLFGASPAGHHYVSLLFHAANAVILFLLLAEATSLAWPSLIVVMLFALHPENVESVAWAAERKNVLSMLFFLLALWAYGRYARKGGVGRYVLVASLFALGMMAKPQIVTLPCVLLLWDYWPLRRMFPDAEQPQLAGSTPRSFSYLLVEKIPLFLLAAAGSAVTVWSQRVGHAMRTSEEYSLSVRVQNAIVSYVRYLANTFWPTKLAPMYSHPGNSLPAWEVVVSAAFLIAFTAVVIHCRKHRYLAVGWFWFLGVLVPMIGLVQVGEQSMADRFMYIPMIGLFVSLVWAITEIASVRKWPRAALTISAVVVLSVLGALTYHQLGYWRDPVTLWRYTVSVTKDNYVAHDTLGLALNKEGRNEEAIAEFRTVESLHKYAPAQFLSLGMFEQANGHLAEAMEEYGKVLRESNDPKLQSSALEQSAEIECERKDFAEGQQDYERALELNPDNAPALVGMGLLAWRGGSASQAVPLLFRAVNIEPTAIRLLLLSDALRISGRIDEAKSAQDSGAKVFSDLGSARQIVNQKYLLYGIDAGSASQN
jgi:protein O-mannosyl-transferase